MTVSLESHDEGRNRRLAYQLYIVLEPLGNVFCILFMNWRSIYRFPF